MFEEQMDAIEDAIDDLMNALGIEDDEDEEAEILVDEDGNEYDIVEPEDEGE